MKDLPTKEELRNKTLGAMKKSSSLQHSGIGGFTNAAAILVDCSSFLYQILFSLLNKSKSYVPTVSDFVYMFLDRTLSLPYAFNASPSVLEYFWDSKYSVRKEECPTYKGNRVVSDDPRVIQGMKNMRKAGKKLRKALKEVGFSSTVKKGFEADDLIAARVSYCIGEVIIASSDTDLYQLISGNVSCFSPIKQTLMTVKTFSESFHILPPQWAWVKAAAGCHSDNVKGVPTIGEKRAIQYILCKNRMVLPITKDDVPPKRLQNIIDTLETKEAEAIIERNLKLVKLPHAKLQLTPGELDHKFPSYERLCDIFPSLEKHVTLPDLQKDIIALRNVPF